MLYLYWKLLDECSTQRDFLLLLAVGRDHFLDSILKGCGRVGWAKKRAFSRQLAD
jgi:hypothetical protein